MTIDTLPASPASAPTLLHDDVRLKTNELVTQSNLIDLDGGYLVKADPVSGLLSLFQKIEGVDVFMGAWGGQLIDQYVFTKSAGGLRFTHLDGNQYFAVHRSLIGGARGAVFGNLDSDAEGNYIATSDEGGLEIYHKTDTAITQQIGNPASTTYIEGTFFTWQVTSDQIKPYGAQALRFIAETDTGFSNIPFDVRVLDENGVELFSDIQNLEVWLQEPQPAGNPRFKKSSVGGVPGDVNLPMSQPMILTSDTTVTIEYRFATPVRLRGDGTTPALVMESNRVEFYPVNYTGEVGFFDSDFIAQTLSDSKIDTTNGDVTAVIHPTVRSLWVGDFDQTWSNTNRFFINWGGATLIEFGQAERGKRYQVIQHGAGYRVYNADGSLHKVVP